MESRGLGAAGGVGSTTMPTTTREHTRRCLRLVHDQRLVVSIHAAYRRLLRQFNTLQILLFLRDPLARFRTNKRVDVMHQSLLDQFLKCLLGRLVSSFGC